jgi:hypothetical protein
MFSCQITLGSSRTQGVALALNQPHDAFEPLPVDEDLLVAITEQREAVRAASARLAEVRRAAKAAGRGGGAKAAATSREGKMRAGRLLRKAARLREEMDAAMATTWNGFLGVMDILVEVQALEAERLAIQPLGLLARSLQVGDDGGFEGGGR